MKLRLAERFGVWPLVTPAHALTAAQAILLAEALAPDKKPETPAPAPRGKGKHKSKPAAGPMPQPRVSRKVLEELARRDDPTVRIER